MDLDIISKGNLATNINFKDQPYTHIYAYSPLTLYSIGYFRLLHHFLFLNNIEKIQEKFKLSLNTFENIMTK